MITEPCPCWPCRSRKATYATDEDLAEARREARATYKQLRFPVVLEMSTYAAREREIGLRWLSGELRRFRASLNLKRATAT